jgi:hypothetical protein
MKSHKTIKARKLSYLEMLKTKGGFLFLAVVIVIIAWEAYAFVLMNTDVAKIN